MQRIGVAYGLCLALALAGFAGLPARAEQKGSYGQINQDLERPLTWERIVRESAFPLGEKKDIGQVGGKPLYEMDYGAYPSIDGSTVAVPMAMEFARQHLSMSELDLEFFVFFNMTHSAYVNLIEKRPNIAPRVPSESAVMDEARPVDLILATQPSDEELALAASRGVELLMEPVCYDAFVFIVHRDNPVDNLTVEQIQAIYGGEITGFAEVGGENLPIAAYQRPKNSGSQTAMEQIVMQGKKLAEPPSDYAFVGMGQLVDAVAAPRVSESSLGYTYKYYIDTLYKNDAIKMISVNGVAPTPENLRSGAYPFTTRYYAVIRAEDRDQSGGRFLDWILSEEGQRCVAQAGYTPATPLP